MSKPEAEKKMIAIDCPYCGQQQMVEIDERMTPTEYQALAAMNCDCPGSWIIRQQEKIKEKIKNDDLEEDAVEAVIDMVKMMRCGFFDKITIKTGKFTYMISLTGEAVLKFKRQESRKEEMTL